jgi:hypothetical protein
MKQVNDVNINVVEIDKIGSATAPLSLNRTVAVNPSAANPSAGDVVAVRALTDSATYNMLELPTGRLAKINPGDLLLGVLGRRRALKGFVGDVPETVQAGDQSTRFVFLLAPIIAVITAIMTIVVYPSPNNSAICPYVITRPDGMRRTNLKTFSR